MNASNFFLSQNWSNINCYYYKIKLCKQIGGILIADWIISVLSMIKYIWMGVFHK